MNNLQLLKNLIKKIFDTVPIYTINSIFTSFVSQFLTMAVFLLPLKIVFMLNIDTIPSYFPEFMHSFNKDQLIYFLTFCSVFSFVLFLIMDFTNKYIIKKASKIIIKSTNKVILFSNQDDIAKQAYRNISVLFSSILFGSVISFILYHLSKDLFIFIFCYIFSVFILFGILIRFKNLKYSIEQNINVYLIIIDSIGFLTSFVFIIYSLIDKTDNNVLAIVISLMIIRLIFSHSKQITLSIFTLIRDKNKVSSIFLDEHLFVNSITNQEKNFWTILERKNIENVFFQLTKMSEGKINIEWRETGIANTITFEINYYNEDRDNSQKYLLKVYNKMNDMHALHEATLLLSKTVKFLEMYKLNYIKKISDFYYHLFILDPNSSPIEQYDFRDAYESIYESLLKNRPEKELINSYCSTKPLLWNRIKNYTLIDTLELFINNEKESLQLNQFEKILPSIINILSELPLQIVNQNILYENIYKSRNGYTFIHWSNWSLDPIGARWPSDERGIKKIKEVFKDYNENEYFGKNININHVLISVYMFELDRFFTRNNYGQVFMYINKILEIFNNDENLKILNRE